MEDIMAYVGFDVSSLFMLLTALNWLLDLFVSLGKLF